MKKSALLLVITITLVGCGQPDPYQRKKFPPIPTERETPVENKTTEEPTSQVQRNDINPEINPELEQARFENPELFEPDGQIKPPLIQMKDLHPELFE